MRLGLFFVVLLLVGCSGEDLERSTPIRTDLNGVWPVACSGLVQASTQAPCTLTGLTLDIRQSGGGGDPFRASLTGTYSSAQLACGGGAPVSQGTGTLSGQFSGSVVNMSLSNGSTISGSIFAPTLSETLLELRLTTTWAGAGGLGTVSGQCTAGPIETRTR